MAHSNVKQKTDKGILDWVAALNKQCNGRDRRWSPSFDFDPSENPHSETRLLPVPYPEGSFMHASYGAGYATTTGACVTILTVMFDHTHKILVSHEVANDGRALDADNPDVVLTVEEQLKRFCSNISIGRI